MDPVIGGVPKITEVGFPCTLDPKEVTDFPGHCPPEYLLGETGSLSPPFDVYSFGVLMWEVWCNKRCTPENIRSFQQFLEYSKSGIHLRYAEQSPPLEVQGITRKAGQLDPKQRPSMDIIVAEINKMNLF